MKPARRVDEIRKSNFVEYLKAQRVTDREISSALKDAATDVNRILQSMPSETVSQRIRRAQYANARDAINRKLDTTYSKVEQSMVKGARRVTEIASEFDSDVIDYLTSTAPDSLDNLVEGMKVAANQGDERLKSRIMTQIDLSPKVYKTNAFSQGLVQKAINNGIVTGKSAREIARTVVSMINPNTPGGVSYAAMRLARTEINNTFHAMSVMSYSEKPWVEGIRWNKSGSHPKPDICDEYAEDDKFGMGAGVWPRMEVPLKPHPQCLCNITPVTPNSTDFISKLLNGDYNDWLNNRGLAVF